MHPTAQDTLHHAPQTIDEAAFLDALARLKRAPLDPKRGLFGPGSVFWEVNRHALPYFLGALQSVQMQLAHPWVAQAVYEHSKVMSDPTKRRQLTYIFLWSIIYGDLDLVLRRSQALFRVHGRVRGQIPAEGGDAGRHAAGSPYHANEVGAMLWVHVTAFYCRVRLYEDLVRPLSAADKDRFVQEAKLYAFCFGIPESAHPTDWAAVEAYVAAMDTSPTLARTEAGMKLRRFLENALPPRVRGGLWTYLGVGLPPRCAALLDQPAATPEHLARARAVRRRLWWLQRLLPAALTDVPAYREARRRLAGKRGPDWLTARMNRAILGVPSLVG